MSKFSIAKLRDLPRFREMNPIPIALIGIGLSVLLVLVALNFDRLPFVNQTKTYQAEVADAADHRVRIPIGGRAESLNLATAAAICLHATARSQRRAGG